MDRHNIPTLEERLARVNEEVDASTVDWYVCGCGNDTWALTTEGDCVCTRCLKAQARLAVIELGPVGPEPEQYNG